MLQDVYLQINKEIIFDFHCFYVKAEYLTNYSL